MKMENMFRVGKYKCRLEYSTEYGMRSEWEPKLPSNLSKKELRQYRDGRNALIVELAKALGGSIVVVET